MQQADTAHSSRHDPRSPGKDSEISGSRRGLLFGIPALLALPASAVASEVRTQPLAADPADLPAWNLGDAGSDAHAAAVFVRAAGLLHPEGAAVARRAVEAGMDSGSLVAMVSPDGVLGSLTMVFSAPGGGAATFDRDGKRVSAATAANSARQRTESEVRAAILRRAGPKPAQPCTEAAAVNYMLDVVEAMRVELAL